MTDREDIIVRSGVREVYVPNKPVDSVELFCGRQDEVSRIIEGVNTGGMHVLLYGDRGVGKTSLSKITCTMLMLNSTITNYHAKICDSSDTFVTIIQSLFQDLSIKCSIKSSSSWDFSFLWRLLSFSKKGSTEYISYDT
uniref:ATP-binding protein n=1 Tax=Alistipes sp. TaxID=1872444 RepID=UPI004057874F